MKNQYSEELLFWTKAAIYLYPRILDVIDINENQGFVHINFPGDWWTCGSYEGNPVELYVFLTELIS